MHFTPHDTKSRMVGAHAWIFVLCTIIAGCGEEAETTALVKGHVTYQDKPLTFGRVIFLHVSGPYAFSDIGEDGSYELLAPLGKCRVAVECREEPNRINPKDADERWFGRSLIPKHYSNHMTSEIEFQVQPGEHRLDLDLKDRTGE